VTGSPGTTSGAPPTGDRPRPSISERAARRDEMRTHGRDRYSALMRSLQAGHELPIYRRRGRITVNWNPVVWTLVRVAVLVVVAYLVVRVGAQWWRENHVETWSGPDATVQSGVKLADCPVVNTIRVDDFPSWVSYGGDVYRYVGLRRPYVGSTTAGYTQTPYSAGSLHLALIDNTPEGQALNTILLWFEGAAAGVDYARTPDCSPP